MSPNVFSPDFNARHAQDDADVLSNIANTVNTSQAHFNAANAQARALALWRTLPNTGNIRPNLAVIAIQNHNSCGSALKAAGK